MADIYNMADTWNNVATTFTAIKMNVTDTTSAAASLLLDLQVGGVSKFNVRKDGLALLNSIFADAAGTIGFASSNRFTSPSNGVMLLAQSGGGFGRLQFGGSTSSFPSLKVSSTALQARLADDSAFTVIQGKLRAEDNAVSESIVPTHTLLIQDAAGTQYKMPVQAA